MRTCWVYLVIPKKYPRKKNSERSKDTDHKVICEPNTWTNQKKLDLDISDRHKEFTKPVWTWTSLVFLLIAKCCLPQTSWTDRSLDKWMWPNTSEEWNKTACATREVMITLEEETNRNTGMPSLNGKQVTMWSFCSKFLSTIWILQNKRGDIGVTLIFKRPQQEKNNPGT